MPLLPAETTETDRSHQGTFQMPALANKDALNASLPAHPQRPVLLCWQAQPRVLLSDQSLRSGISLS